MIVYINKKVNISVHLLPQFTYSISDCSVWIEEISDFVTTAILADLDAS